MTAAKKASAKKAASKKATGTKKSAAKKDVAKKAKPTKATAARAKPVAKAVVKNVAQKKDATAKRAKSSTKKTSSAKEKKVAKVTKVKSSKSAKAVEKKAAEEIALENKVLTADEVVPEVGEEVKAKPRSSKRRTPAPDTDELRDYFPTERHPKLGFKFVCFACNTKFYDLNKPKAICPKCSADQADRPRVPVEKPKKVQRKSKPPMASLLAEEESIDMLPDDISPREPDLLEDSDIEAEAVFGDDAEFEIEEEEDDEPEDNFF